MTDLLARLRLEQERRGVLENSIVAREGRVKALMAWMEPKGIFEARETMWRRSWTLATWPARAGEGISPTSTPSSSGPSSRN